MPWSARARSGRTIPMLACASRGAESMPLAMPFPYASNESRKLAVVAWRILVKRRVAAVVVERNCCALDRRRGHVSRVREDQLVEPAMRDKRWHRDLCK